MKRVISLLTVIAMLMSFSSFSLAEDGGVTLTAVTRSDFTLELDGDATVIAAECYENLSNAWSGENSIDTCIVSDDGKTVAFSQSIGENTELLWDEAFYVRITTSDDNVIFKKFKLSKVAEEDFEGYGGNEYNYSTFKDENDNSLFSSFGVYDNSNYGVWNDSIWPGTFTLRNTYKGIKFNLLPTDSQSYNVEYEIKNKVFSPSMEGAGQWDNLMGFVIGYSENSTLNNYKAGHPAYTGQATSGWVSDDVGYVEAGFTNAGELYIGARKKDTTKSYSETRIETDENHLGTHKLELYNYGSTYNVRWTNKDSGNSNTVSMDLNDYHLKSDAYISIYTPNATGYNDYAMDNILIYSYEDLADELELELNIIKNAVSQIENRVLQWKDTYGEYQNMTLLDEEEILEYYEIYEFLPDDLKEELSEDAKNYILGAKEHMNTINLAAEQAGFDVFRRVPNGYILSFDSQTLISDVFVNGNQVLEYNTFDDDTRHYLYISDDEFVQDTNVIIVNGILQVLVSSDDSIVDEEISIIDCNDETIEYNNTSLSISGAVFGETFEAIISKFVIPLDCEFSDEAYNENKIIIRKIFDITNSKTYTISFDHYITVKSPYALDDTVNYQISNIDYNEAISDFSSNINRAEGFLLKLNGKNIETLSGIIKDGDILEVYEDNSGIPVQTFTVLVNDRPVSGELESSKYTIENSVISTVKVGTTVQDFIADLNAENATVKVYDINMREKTTGTMDGNEIVKVCPYYPTLDDKAQYHTINYSDTYTETIVVNDTKSNSFVMGGSDVQSATTAYLGYDGRNPSMLWSDDGYVEFTSNVYKNDTEVIISSWTAIGYPHMDNKTSFEIFKNGEKVLTTDRIDNTLYEALPQFVEIARVNVSDGDVLTVRSVSKAVPFSAVKFADCGNAYIETVGIDGDNVSDTVGIFENVSVYEELTATIKFSEKMNSSLINNDNILLVSENGYKLNYSLSYDENTNICTLTTDNLLRSGKTYYLVLTQDLMTLDGYNLARTYTYLISTVPEDNKALAYVNSISSEGTGANISLKISNDADAGLYLLVCGYENGYIEVLKEKIEDIQNLDDIDIAFSKPVTSKDNIKMYLIDENYLLYEIVEIN